jgi:hypothetical protein
LIDPPDAATSVCITTVPPLVSSVAVAIGEALPVAAVSLVIAFAVAVPELDAANAVADSGNVAAAVPGLPTVPVSRYFRFPLAPIRAVTASVAALRAAVLCVVAILGPLLLNARRLRSFDRGPAYKLVCLDFARRLARDLHGHMQFCGLACQVCHAFSSVAVRVTLE